jgi:hypothetical protein
MSWKSNSKRILYFGSAIIIGSLFVYLISLAGNKSKGPVEYLLEQSSNAVRFFEKILILDKRIEKREKQLAWFLPLKEDIKQLKSPSRFMLGGSDHVDRESFETIISLEDTLQTTFPLIQIYCAWGSKEIEEFPMLEVEAIKELGSVPVITWEPWLSDFDEKEFPGIPPAEMRDKECLSEIAKGVYDSYIKTWAEKARDVQTPLFIRLGHEMNDPYRYPWGPQNNKPEDFVAAWRHVHFIFSQVGATNIIWIWSPHPAYNNFYAYYPGDKYVDFVGVGILNFGTAANWSKWWTFEDLFGNHYPELSSFQKPIMITEFGSLGVGGNRSQWFADAFDSIPTKYPLLKSIIFYHYAADKTTTDKAVNWYFKDDPAVVEAIRQRIAKY